MKPGVYIDSRAGSGERGSTVTDHIIFDVGQDATVAYISLPVGAGDVTPELEWARNALSPLTDEAVCTAAADKGLVEFEVADVLTGRLFTVQNLTAELLQALSSPGGLSERARDAR